MRIVHTCLRYPPATGGVETYVKEIVERTRNISVQRDVRVITSTMRTHGPVSMLDSDLLLDDPPYVQRVHVNQTPLVSYPRLGGLDYYLGHHQPDIVHGHSFWYQPADVAARYAKKRNLPFILHPMFYETEVRQKLVWQLYKKTIGRATFAAADVVAVISPHEQQLIEQAGLPVKRFELLPPGIDMPLHVERNPYHERGITGPVLLTVSRLAKDKGVGDVITAFGKIHTRHPQAHLVIIGEDFGEADTLKDIVQALHLSDHIHFWGKVSTEELRAAYQHATMLIHASHYEAFGIVVAEAQACGTPVVARNVAAIPYVAPHNKTGLLFNNEPELYQAIDTLLSQPELAMRLGSQGHDHVKRNFSWDTTIKKLTALYEELSQ